jgi:hypothetical protein
MHRVSLTFLWLCVSWVHAWVSSPRVMSFHPLAMSTTPEQTEDPCWQDLYDDDCSMSSVYSASFVAGKWIKSMPCASGLDEVRYYYSERATELPIIVV